MGYFREVRRIGEEGVKDFSVEFRESIAVLIFGMI